jgi:hypothetical protein
VPVKDSFVGPLLRRLRGELFCVLSGGSETVDTLGEVWLPADTIGSRTPCAPAIPQFGKHDRSVVVHRICVSSAESPAPAAVPEKVTSLEPAESPTPAVVPGEMASFEDIGSVRASINTELLDSWSSATGRQPGGLAEESADPDCGADC